MTRQRQSERQPKSVDHGAAERADPRRGDAAVAAASASSRSRPLTIPARRQLRFATSEPGLDLIRVRSFDVATFVAFGAAQLGVAGNDVLMEFDYSEIYAPLDLDVGHCRIAVAATGRLGRRRTMSRRCEPHPRRDEIPGDYPPPFRGARRPGGMHQAERRDRARAAPRPLPPHRRSRSDRRHAEGQRSGRDRAHRRGQLAADRQPPGAEDPPGRGRRLDRALSRARSPHRAPLDTSPRRQAEHRARDEARPRGADADHARNPRPRLRDRLPAAARRQARERGGCRCRGRRDHRRCRAARRRGADRLYEPFRRRRARAPAACG